MLVAALLMAPGLGLAQEKVPSEGTPPPPPTNLGTLPGTGCGDSGGTNCPSGTIPDGDGVPVVSTFTFSGCGGIEDVNVGLDITHTWIGDLIVSVEGPSGTNVQLLDRPGLPGQDPDVGCQDNNVFAVLDDEGTEPAEDACPGTNATPGLSGDLIPTALLSAFDGQSADGEWTLRVSDNFDLDPGNLNDWTLEITCAQSDLAIDKTATVNEDATVDFTITVDNNGPSDATGVEVGDPLPACVTYQSDDCGAGDGDPFTWAIGELAVDAAASCTVVVDAAGCVGEGEQTNTATVTAEQADPVTDNDSGEATFEITDAMSDLSLSQTATVGPAAAGASRGSTTSREGSKGARAAGGGSRVENGSRAAGNGDATVVLALEVTNAGPDDATGVVVTNELPECAEVVSDDCGGEAGPPWTWEIGDLATDASASCSLTLDASQCSGEQAAAGQVSANQSDPNPDDNTVAATFEIEVVPALPALALVLLAALLALAASRGLRWNRA